MSHCHGVVSLFGRTFQMHQHLSIVMAFGIGGNLPIINGLTSVLIVRKHLRSREISSLILFRTQAAIMKAGWNSMGKMLPTIVLLQSRITVLPITFLVALNSLVTKRY